MAAKKAIREVAIQVSGLSKTFRIPKEKETTVKGAVVGLLNSKAKGYEVFHALDNVNFEVKKGEFFGIIGRNGCGKSTLLKILAGIYVPDRGSGRVEITGKLSPFLELGVGFNNELTGRENIYLGGTILGLSKKEIDKKFNTIVAFSELEEFIDMKLKNYSSGMQVRLAFALAINVEAEILLMDEVLAVGDTNFQSKCLAEFNRYKEMGKTVVLVTHDIGTVQRYCDRVMLIRNGEVEQIGEPEEVVNTYITQNIQDEEKRLDGENDRGEDSNFTRENKPQVDRVEFLDGKGKSKNVFETGEDIVVRIHFKNPESLSDLNFGMTIVSQENLSIIGVGTFRDKVKTAKYVSQGYFEVKYHNVQLGTNTFHINAAVFGKSDEIVYDYRVNINHFKVVSRTKNDGLLVVDYDWK